MLSVTFFNRRFTPSWFMFALSLLSIYLFTHLGFWQLERAAQKQSMLAAQASFAKQAMITWQSNNSLPEQYRRIFIEGNYLPQTLLLDNQHYQHQFGYHVISPLQLDSGEVVLVDRGWVKGEATRGILPALSVPSGKIKLAGYAYYPSEKNWVLGQVLEIKNSQIAVIERIDSKLIGQFLHKSVYPFIIRLDKNASDSYVREWQIIAMSPERHYAYAVQWFALAFVIAILFIALNVKKIK